MINEYQKPAEVFHNTRINKSKNNVYFRYLIFVTLGVGIVFFLLHMFLDIQHASKIRSLSFMQYTAKQGFSFSYPAGWTLGTGSNSIDISDENVPSDDPQAGIKAHWSVEENIPQMVPNGEAEAAPLMADEYTTINGISAFRKAVQVKQGDEVQGETATVTRTMITYQLLKDNTIYRFNCEIDNNNPKELMQICDTIAKSFSFVK